jgi:hypothetical protein
MKEEIKSNGGSNDLSQSERRKSIERHVTYLCNISRNDCRLCKEIKNIVEPRR